MTPERALCSGHTAPCTAVRASRPDSNTGLTSPFQGSLMAMTLRLKPDLSAEAQAYADALGISVNALIVVALRDYLDQRGRVPALPPAAAGRRPPRHPPEFGRQSPAIRRGACSPLSSFQGLKKLLPSFQCQQ
jgi:hypothetical protein